MSVAFLPPIEEVVSQYGGALARIAGSYERSAAGREDLIVTLMQAQPRFRGDSALGTFVYRVVTNPALDRLARHSPRMLEVSDASGHSDPSPGYTHCQGEYRDHDCPLPIHPAFTAVVATGDDAGA